MYQYAPQGVCSRQINFDIKDGKVYNCQFVGGCNGNLKGIGKLIEGMDAKDIINRLKGNTCGGKNTSCPDQLAIALEQALAMENQ